MSDTIEKIILRFSGRGMDILSKYLPRNFCEQAADALLNCRRGTVYILTGFYVNGTGETDGPPGSFFLSRALSRLGFRPIILTDRYCENYFDYDSGVETAYVPVKIPNASMYFENMMKKNPPVAFVSIERCGRNITNSYGNMRKTDITAHTAPLDELFLMNSSDSLKIAIGDGGNEIGMGLLKEVINEHFSVSPCVVSADHLIIATVSNWGSLGLMAYLQAYSGVEVMPGGAELKEYFEHILACGATDGIRGPGSISTDGFDFQVDLDILKALQESITRVSSLRLHL
jgi:hypothetical protein